MGNRQKSNMNYVQANCNQNQSGTAQLVPVQLAEFPPAVNQNFFLLQNPTQVNVNFKTLYVKKTHPFCHDDSSNIQTIEQLVQNCLPNILDRTGHHTGGELMGPRERSTSNRDEAQKHSFVFENEQVRFQVTVTIPGGKRYFFFVDFSSLPSGGCNGNLSRMLADEVRNEINMLAGSQEVCQFAKEKPTEEKNLFFSPLPMSFREHDEQRFSQSIVDFMRRNSNIVMCRDDIKSTKVQCQYSDKPPVGFCRVGSDELANHILEHMNGIKWSQIEPDCDPENDRVLSVKPANAPGNSKKVNNFIPEQPHFNQNLTQLVWQAQVCVPNTGMTPFQNSPIQSLVQNTGTTVGIPNNIPLQNFQQAAPVQAQYAQPIHSTNIPVALNEHQFNSVQSTNDYNQNPGYLLQIITPPNGYCANQNQF